MSIHLVECAANLPLPPSTKLALMAFADSADRFTHLAMPGLEQVMRWSSVGRSRAAEIVAELADLELLEKRTAGHRGRRATYVVFPRGCCSEHPRPPADEPDDVDVQPTGKGSGGPESLSGKGSTPPDPNPHDAKGSGPADPMSGKGSGRPDTNQRVRPSGGFTRKGSGKGPVASGPLPSVNTKPPHPPTADAAGGATHSRCQRPGPLPHANCRGCGTTNRQIAAAEKQTKSAQRREQDQARLREQQERARAQAVPSDDARDAIAKARASIGARR